MSRLIAVTGPIAAGATTLGQRLCELSGWTPMFERDVERTNPFFSAYHRDRSRWAFHNQVGFLTQSLELHAEMRDGQSPDNSEPSVFVQDYTPFEHTEVYASVQRETGILSDDEFRLLDRLATSIAPLYTVPAVLVYRPLDHDKLKQRVEERDRPSERALEPEYLKAVSERFEQWIAGWTRGPVVRVEAGADVLHDDALVRAIANSIIEKWDKPENKKP